MTSFLQGKCSHRSGLEPPGPGMFRTKRADGLTLAPWSRGKSLIWDATCAETLCRSYVDATSRSSGAAARKIGETEEGCLF
jgi:hypothetical protein